MNIQEHNQLHSEQNALRRMLAGIPAENVLDRSGMEARLEEVEERLATGGAPRRGPVRAVLTFGGRPVLDRRGIFADFGSQAANRFAEAVAKVAAGLAAPLAAMGPIPKRADSQLLITSTAVGSFGFERTSLGTAMSGIEWNDRSFNHGWPRMNTDQSLSVLIRAIRGQNADLRPTCRGTFIG